MRISYWSSDVCSSDLADVVNEADGVVFTQLPATVDDFLATAFHFRVFPLDRGEVQVRRTGAGGHGGSGAATQADQHGRATEDDQLGADQDLAFLNMFGADVAHAAGEHDRLVEIGRASCRERVCQ